MAQVGLVCEDRLDLFRQANADVSHGTRICNTVSLTLKNTSVMRVNRQRVLSHPG